MQRARRNASEWCSGCALNRNGTVGLAEAEKMGENPSGQQVTPQAVAIGETLLQTLLENAREIGSGTPKGLKLLLDLLCMEVQALQSMWA